MKRTWFALLAAALLVSASGCLHHEVNQPNGPCGDGQCQGLLGGLLAKTGAGPCGRTGTGCPHHAADPGPPGPPTGAYAYPYYTLHGPRDFLASDPPSLGR
jgi:hypothetical protein